MGGAGSNLGDAVTATDHECAYQGTTRTITTTLTGTTTAAVVAGYTVKYTDKVVTYGGGTGNQSVTYNVVYVPVTAGVATFDVVCSADHLPLASNAALNDGAAAGLEYYESHEVTVDLGTAALGTGYPAGGVAADITGGSIVGNTDVGCDDVPRAYADSQRSLVIGANRAVASLAGTLTSATATATDQYGDGIAGVTVSFSTITKKNVALTAEASTTTARSSLITNASGTATYSGVACDTASVGHSGSVAFSIADLGGSIEAATLAASVPTAAIEGTTIHCVAAGVDASLQTATTGTINVADVAGNDEVQTISFVLESDGTTAADPHTGQTFTCSYDGEVTDAIDGNDDSAAVSVHFNDNANLSGVVITWNGANTEFAIAFLANTGDHPTVSCTETAIVIAAGGAAMIRNAATTAPLVGASTGAAVITTAGAYGTTFDHIDHDPAANTLVALRTVKQRTAAGAAVVTTDYSEWGYDDTDALNTATLGLSMTEWEAALKADAGTSATDLSIAYRLAATVGGSGVSSFKLG